MVARSDIPLFDVGVGKSCIGALFDAIEDRHLADFETSWSNSLQQLLAASPGNR